MKKLNVIILALIASIGAMAQSTVVLNITAANDSKDVLNLIEVSTFSPAYAQSEDYGPKLMPAGDHAYIYSVLEAKECSQIGTNNLVGTWITLKTNSSTSYTFSFTGLTGSTFTLIDHLLNKTTPMTDETSYTFTAEANKTISDRFEVGEYVPGDFSICHQYGKLIMDDNPYTTTNIVVKNADGETVIDQPSKPVHQEIVVDTLPAGHYTVEFDGGAKEYVISVNPTVTPDTPVVP